MIRGGGIRNTACGEAGTADGTAIQSGRAAAANARSATYSSGQLAGVSYTVTATTVSSPDSDKNPPGTEKTVDATAADDGSHRFYIELLEGTYTLSVEGFLGEGDGKKKILEGTYRNADTNNKVVIGPTSSPDNCNILVNPIFDGGGTGTVSLTLSMAADCNIKCLKAVWEADGTQKTRTFTDFTDGGNDFSTALFTMTADGESSSGIPAGFHRVDFYFYGDAGGTDELYSCTQYLNVFENLTTDLWRNNGATPYIDDDGNFTLTRSVIYSRKLFYVQNRNDSEKGEGTRYSPFDSVQTAVQKILAANDGKSEYKIALLSDDTDESTSSYSPDTNFSYICINPDKPLKLIIESDISESRDINGGNPFTINAARTDGKTGRVMYTGQNATVTLKNVSITGGYASGTGGDVSTTIGGGVLVSGGTFIMESGTQISGNTADYGGGVRVNGHSLGEKGGTFIMNGGTISGNTAVNDGGGLCVCDADAITLGSGLIADNRAAAGGGIYFEGSGTDSGGTVMFTMSGTTVSGNTAAYNSESTYGGDGGGIYIYDSSVEMTACTIGGSEDAEGNSAEKSGGGIYSTGKLTVSGGTIENCTAGTSGGGIYNNVTDASITCTLTDCTISGCKALGTESGQGGGGICNNAGTLELTNCTITGGGDTGNPDARYGGGVYNNGTLKMIDGSVTKCTATYSGGIYNKGTLTITDGTISSCTATYSGGGVYNAGSFTMTGGTIGGTTDAEKNTSERANGGGVFISSNGTFTMTDGTVSRNVAAVGGGVGISGTFTMIGGEISGNTTKNGGAGVYVNGGTFKMKGGTISRNTATNYGGGGVYNQAGTFTMEGGTISENAAGSEGKGGGVYVINGSFTMKGGTISRNEAKNGGGVYNSSTFTMESGTISGNSAKSFGGGVYNAGSFTMTGGTVSGNEATSSGGGVFVSTSGIFTMESGAVSGNTTTSNGGGVYIDGSTFTMNGGEISGNTATDRGGGMMSNGTFTMGGSASVPAGDDGKNDVYLASGKTIGIASALTATTPVATITPNAYTAGTQVVSAADGSTATLAANYEKFAVTAESDGTEWLIAADGTLKLPVPEGFVRVNGGTVVGKNYAGVFIAGRAVTLCPFYMCDHEVTQGEYAEVMTGNSDGLKAHPSYCTENSSSYAVPFGNVQENRPVDGVSWYDAVYYCNARSEREGLDTVYDISSITVSSGNITSADVTQDLTKNGYRLPTEAEWEFAARGGDPNAAAWDYMFSGAATASGVAHTSDGNSGMDSVGWYSWNNKDGTTGAASVTGDASGKGTHEVKQKNPNALDIYDMSGNVNEWCWDWYGMVASDTPGTGPASGSSSSRILRGGAWISNANDCSVSNRNNVPPNCCNDNVGFRVVRSVSQ